MRKDGIHGRYFSTESRFRYPFWNGSVDDLNERLKAVIRELN